MIRSLFVALAFLATGVCATAGETALNTDAQKIGYAIGTIMSRQLGPVAKHLDLTALIQGLNDGVAGKAPALKDEEMQAAMESLQKIMQEDQKVDEASKGKFLEENKDKPGVKVTASGLQYKVITEGTGKTPKAEDTVQVHYKGTLVNGTEFDSSYKRGEPATFPVNRVIPGWTEALQLMKEGAKYQLFIPSKLAYGERGTPDGAIGPNEPLIFEVELIKIQDSKPAAK